MTKIIILGAQGMLGQAMVNAFQQSQNYQIIAWDKQDLDITDKTEVNKKIDCVKPNIVINCAAYTDVDGAESHSDLAIEVNAKAVRSLAKASRLADAFLIHFSTDYVFDGTKKQGYTEADFSKKAVNVYGESKRLGEKALQEEKRRGLKYYLIRTSWLFGPGGKNFVATMLNLAKQTKTLKIVNDQYGKPTYTKDLAQTTKILLESKREPGIYHFTNEPELSWYDFAKIIFCTKHKLNSDFESPELIPVTSSELRRPAKRPTYSILLNTKLPRGRQIEETLRDYFLELNG